MAPVFSITTRTMIKTLFDLGTVNQIGGDIQVGSTEIHWYIIRRLKSIYWDTDCFDVFIMEYEKLYDLIVGAALDESLSALEAKMDELADASKEEESP